MFEAKLSQAALLKKVLESMKDLVTETNFDCSSSGIALQAMDSSHVSLISLLLRNDGFEKFQCHRPVSLGLNLGSMAKVLKCAGNEDSLTLKAEEGSDILQFLFESKNADKESRFELKLMDIQGEALGIPDTEYKAKVKLPSSEFQRICRDMTILGDTVTIDARKDQVKFSVSGELGSGSIALKQTSAVDSDEAVQITLQESCTLTFALRYLNFFTKATSLSPYVSLSLSPELPLVVEYEIEQLGYIRYYLAPKIEEEGA